MAVLTTGRIPVRLTPLVGRDAELAALTNAAAESRLITLTGPGGAGKTRLALAAATGLAAGETDVAWVELAQLGVPALVARTVASRLGVPETPGQDPAAATAAQLAARRDGRPVLVVLDNCEHLAAAVAELAEYLLAECPALSLLATSREPLAVEGERSWPVPPLDRPDAVRLFADRARLVAPSFGVTDSNRDAIAALCGKLDGLPLAIELAAARMRVLSVRQLTDRLDDVFGLLTGGARSAPARHQALRATLDWSHDLLTPDERVVFRRLAVFSGGFSLEAAEWVVAFGDIAAGQVLDLLTRLADKSLVQVDSERHQLLATIHEYAAERLAEAGEWDQASRAHLAYYTEFAEQAGPRVELAVADQLEAELDQLDAERANLRGALNHARRAGHPDAALRIVGQLGRYAYLRGHYTEIRQWMDQAVTAGQDAPGQLRARALLGSGRLAHLQCDYEPAVRRMDAALLLYRSLGDGVGIAACLQALGSVAREQGRYARAVQLHAEGLELARAAGDQRAQASAHSYLGFVCWLQGDFGRATAECAAALEMFRALRDAEGIAWSLISLGTVARYQGELPKAATLLSEALETATAIGFREGIAWCAEQLGLAELARGSAAGARALLVESFAIHRQLRDRWRMSSVLADLAATELAATERVLSQPGPSQPGPSQPAPGDAGSPFAQAADRAAYLLGAAQAMRNVIGTVLAPSERPQHEATAAAARAIVGDLAFDAAWQRGLDVTDPDAALDDLGDPVPAGTALAGTAPIGTAPAGTAPTETRAAGAGTTGATGSDGTAAAVPDWPAGRGEAGGDEGEAASVPDDGSGSGQTAGAAGQSSAAPGTPAPPAPLARQPGLLTIRALGTATVELGETTLTAADWGYAKPRELLFLLVTSPALTREQIGAALWPDLSRQQLGNALHTALRELRRALGDPDWVVYSGGRYAINRTRPLECDVDAFESALAAASRQRPAPQAQAPDSQGAAAGPLAGLLRAIAAYGGDFLAGMSTGEWAHARRDELRRRFETALLAAGRLHTVAGRHQAAAALFRRAVEHEPLNESAHRELMSSWAKLGETARAVQHYRELVALLAGQVGVSPAAETTALYERLAGPGGDECFDRHVPPASPYQPTR
jgi:predicted ATPase/DNA-binding SARP family transcriptional activator